MNIAAPSNLHLKGKLMMAVVLRLLVSVLVASLLAGCGGGGGGNTGVASGSSVYISGNVNEAMWPLATGGTQLQYMATLVVATSTFNGPPISNANADVNGTQLTYDAALKIYKGIVVPDAAGKFVLTVVANGETHTASAVAMTTRPVLTVPNPFFAAQGNTISWSPAGGVVSGATPVSYYLEVADYNNFGPTRLAYKVSTASLSTLVPANSTNPTTPYYATIYAGYISTMIASAASGSNFGVSASGDVAYFTPQ